ncbi:MAG: hypothetical protein ABWK05_06900, partial [Pyrobaculum sp.]
KSFQVYYAGTTIMLAVLALAAAAVLVYVGVSQGFFTAAPLVVGVVVAFLLYLVGAGLVFIVAFILYDRYSLVLSRRHTVHTRPGPRLVHTCPPPWQTS